jgi:hypothetical protein
VRATQLKVGGEYARWREWSMDAPERLVLLELQEKGRVMVRRDDGEQEHIRTTDLAGPFDAAQRQYEARKAEQLRMMELRLTWEQFSAGEPSPGCGRPYRGSRIELPGVAVQLLEAGEESGMVDPALTVQAEPLRAQMVEELLTAGCVKQAPNGLVITDRGRGVLADRREDEAFLARHRDCHAHRHGVAGGPVHCGHCCPPPPISPEVLAKIAVLLRPTPAGLRSGRSVTSVGVPTPRPRLRLTENQQQLLETTANRRGMPVKEALTALLTEAAAADGPFQRGDH